MEPLGEDEVHLWLADPRQANDALLESYAALLAPEERARHARFRHSDRRREYLFTRALVRTTLSRYFDRAPQTWTFAANAHGAPYVSPPALAPGLRFNLSNTHGLVACAVARGREVGVDVEWLRRGGRPLAVAHRYFADDELSDLRARPPERQLDRFFDLWTLKEAYIKARGMGLAIPLSRFAFRFADDGGIGLNTDASLGDDGGSWHAFKLDPTAEHRAAVLVRRRAAAPTLRLRWTVPLR